MKNRIYVPNTMREAGRQLRNYFASPVDGLSKIDFLRAWCSLAYLFPGLHPDGFDDEVSGWPRVLKRVAAEAWRRADAGELADDELYPCDSQWAGLYDRMTLHLPEETERRLTLASSFKESANA
jgi:hypothetical protein